MADRAALIDRKHRVIADIQRTRRELERLRHRDDRGSQRRARETQARLEALMAEEYRLRLQIDRAGGS